MRRRYWPHRQAYAPRLWPVLLAAFVVVMLESSVLRYGFGIDQAWYVTDLVAIASSFVIAEANWRRWKRKHPIVSPPMKVRVRLDDDGDFDVEVEGLDLIVTHVERQREVARWQ